MAIIREKQSFQIGTIGVARASEGGRITGQAISQSANKIGAMLFEKAADEAQKAGLESGQSVDREQVIAINPQTGEPEAYDPPEGMGTIAADAYQRVVMDRFQRSIEDEIQNKARELAVRYENSSNGVALYTEAMSEYLSSMTDVAQDEFKGYINDVGTSYLNSTRTSMAAAQLRRERAAARRSQAAAVNDGLNNLFNVYANGGPSAISSEGDDPTIADVVNEGVNAAINNGGQAGLFNPEEVANYNADQRLAAATGLVTYYARQEGTDPQELDKMRLAIGMGNLSAIPVEFAGVAELLQGISGNRQAMSRADTISNAVLSDSIRFNTILQNEEQERLNQEARLRIFIGGQTLPALTASEEDLARTGQIHAVTERAIINYNESQALMQSYLVDQDAASFEFEQARQSSLIGAVAQGLSSRALNGLTPEEVLQIQEAITTEDFDLAPTDESRAVLRALSELEDKTGIPVLQQFDSVANSYGSGGAIAVEMREQQAALEELGEVFDINVISSADDPEAAAAAMQDSVDGIANLADQNRQAAQNQINYAVASRLVNQFFSDSTLTEMQLDQVATAVRGGTIPSDVFSDRQISLLQNINRYAQASGDSSGIQGDVGGFVTGRKNYIADSAARQEAQVLSVDILNGGGNPGDADHRNVAHENALTGTGIDFPVIPQMFSDPRFLNSPEGQQYLNNARSMNVMPEPLYTAMVQLDNGQFTGDIGEFSRVIANFETINVRGQVITNPAFMALPAETRALLSYFADLPETLGTQDETALAQAYRQYQEYENNPRNRALLNQRLGLEENGQILDYVYTINDGAWFAEGLDEAPLSVANNLVAMTLRLGALNLSEAKIRSELEKQLDRTYPVSDAVVNINGGNRTIHALEITENITGHESLFKQFVLNQVAQSNPNLTNILLGGVGGNVTPDANPQLGLGGFSLSAFEGGPDINRIFLRALPSSAGQDVRYTVHMTDEEGFTQEILKEYRLDPRGEGDALAADTFVAPLIVSNTDPSFLQQRQAAINAERAANIGAGEYTARIRSGEFSPITGLANLLFSDSAEMEGVDQEIERAPTSRERANEIVLESKESLFGRLVQPIINPQWLRDMQ